jgi:hypothetical protein
MRKNAVGSAPRSAAGRAQPVPETAHAAGAFGRGPYAICLR